ncbi:unnamed protein product [Lampetra planeri]
MEGVHGLDTVGWWGGCHMPAPGPFGETSLPRLLPGLVRVMRPNTARRSPGVEPGPKQRQEQQEQQQQEQQHQQEQHQQEQHQQEQHQQEQEQQQQEQQQQEQQQQEQQQQ